MASGGSYTFWLGASADADPALVASDQAAKRLDPTGVDPLRVWAVIEKHGKVIRLDLLLDLMRALNLRLVTSRIAK